MKAIRFLVCAALVVFASLPLCAQTGAQQSPSRQVPPVTGTLNQSQPKVAQQQLLKVTISGSRVSVTRDGSYGVYADLENISEDPIKVRPQDTMLIVQPEVAQPSARVALERGIFPTQTATNGDPTKTDGIVIQPNEHYKVFWELTTPNRPPIPCDTQPKQSTSSAAGDKESKPLCADRWRVLTEYLGFVPGEYAFTVEGIAYAPNSKGESVAHTYTETTTLHVGLSQMSTAIAAFIGALLAYFVVALQPGQDFEQWRNKPAVTPPPATASSLEAAGSRLRTAYGWLKATSVVGRNALAAGFLGAALTIVASRLSDTQFPIKVSVNDFWGALTIGFITYFIGNRLLANIIERFAPPTKPGNTPDAGNPNVGNPPAQNPASSSQSASAGLNSTRTAPSHEIGTEEGELVDRH